MKAPLPLLAVLLASTAALAHDMWLVPSGQARVGQPVEIRVAVGMDFPSSLNAIDHDRLTTRAIGPDGKSVAVELGATEDETCTTASFTPTASGAWILAVETRPNRLELAAAKFNDYLLHDGLPHVLAGRMDRGELDRDATERYSKYVKCFVPVGGATEIERIPGALGQTLEIVPLADPTSLEVGETVEVQVLFQGKVLERANLCWDHPGNGEAFTGQTWTDENGKALVPIGRSGLMTLRLVHMTRPMTDDHEWESFWASCTFRIQ